jgi:hypothetical protein
VIKQAANKLLPRHQGYRREEMIEMIADLP